jgi:hypothetical protein
LNQLKKLLMEIPCCNESASDKPLMLMLTATSLHTLREEIGATLCGKDLVKGAHLDEAHLVPTDGEAYWEELLKVDELLLKKLKPDVRVILATATCTLTTYRDIQKRTGVKMDHTIWGNMGRRDVFLRFEVTTLNEREGQMASVIKTFLAKHPAMKVLVYTNHAKDAKGRLNSPCLKVLEEMTEDADVDIANPNAVYVLQGQETDMMKVRIMSEFEQEIAESEDPCQILVGTGTVKCGVSSVLLRLALRDELAPTLEDCYQEEGRTGQKQERDGINDSYHIMASVNGLAILAKPAYDESPNKKQHLKTLQKKRKLAISQQMKLVGLLVLAEGCYKLSLERYF